MKNIFGILLLILICRTANAQVIYSMDSCGVYVSSTVDSENNSVAVNCACKVVKFHMSIYNRWGSVVFETKVFPSVGKIEWDVSKLDTGIYSYDVTYKIDFGKVKKVGESKGKITVSK